MKKFTNHSEKIEILTSRGLNIENPEAAIKILTRITYYKLINGYRDPFSKKPSSAECEVYFSGATFNEIFSLYEFDRKLRHILLEYILIVENHIKQLISYVFSEKNGHKHYLIKENFEYYHIAQSKYQDYKNKNVDRLLASLDIAMKNSKNDFIAHYEKEHGYIPLWVLANIMTFGHVSNFYSCMKIGQKNSISREFNMQPKELEVALKNLNIFRNKCAHEERLFDIRTRENIHDTNYHEQLSIPVIKSRYIYGKSDLFSLIIMLKILLTDDEFYLMCEKIKMELQQLNERIKSIEVKSIHKKMGFPDNWLDIR